MSLYEPGRTPDVEPEDAIVVVHRFLQQARTWATDREIPKRLDRVSDGAGHSEAAKLAAWVAWRDFVDHALRELEDGTLDDWFARPPTRPRTE
jgi:hypothetical protein